MTLLDCFGLFISRIRPDERTQRSLARIGEVYQFYELSQVAMRLLSVPASEANCERTIGIERDALGPTRFAL
jgi:hypothetical protein